MAIQAWGKVNVSFYAYKGEEGKRLGCRSCSASCAKGGVIIRLTEKVSLTEVCFHPYCVNTKESSFHQVISLPDKIVVKRY